MMPDGLTFVSSWVAADLSRCFQLMEANDITTVDNRLVRSHGVRDRAGGGR
jgi:hypothetical protein